MKSTPSYNELPIEKRPWKIDMSLNSSRMEYLKIREKLKSTNDGHPILKEIASRTENPFWKEVILSSSKRKLPRGASLRKNVLSVGKGKGTERLEVFMGMDPSTLIEFFEKHCSIHDDELEQNENQAFCSFKQKKGLLAEVFLLFHQMRFSLADNQFEKGIAELVAEKLKTDRKRPSERRLKIGTFDYLGCFHNSAFSAGVNSARLYQSGDTFGPISGTPVQVAPSQCLTLARNEGFTVAAMSGPSKNGAVDCYGMNSFRNYKASSSDCVQDQDQLYYGNASGFSSIYRI
ncbi:hypothetical protein Gasu2_33820 [Galdieria sulphuraria]|nr:hypothetical protein Gasu2_33820 [Galdieria sulphuraria]